MLINTKNDPSANTISIRVDLFYVVHVAALKYTHRLSNHHFLVVLLSKIYLPGNN